MPEPINPAPAAITAACGAYLLVAAADARVEALEEARFLGGVINEASFKGFHSTTLASEYNRLLKLLKEDYDAAEAEILRAIARVRDDAAAAEAVKVSARQAIIADQVVKPQEEVVLARIARALGLPPEEL